MRFHSILTRQAGFCFHGAKRCALSVAIAVVFSMAAASTNAQPASTAPRFTVPTSSAKPVLVMRQRPTELGEKATQELSVFADGRCRLQRPAIMRGAGEHEWTISPDEVKVLLEHALDAGLADLDAQSHRAKLRARAKSPSSEVHHFRFDDDTIEFDIRVDGYRAPGRSVRRDVKRSIAWRGLRTDHSRNPDDVSVRLLVELRDELDSLSRAHALVDAQP